MRTTYDPSLKATVILDESGRVRGINYLDEYREIDNFRGREAATAYVRDIAGTFNIASEALRSLEQPVSYLDPKAQEVEYRFSEEKGLFDTDTYAYYQTYLNTPVWAAGLTATIEQAPARVVAATNTSEDGIDAKMPSTEAIERYRRLFATGEKVDGLQSRPTDTRPKSSEAASSDLLAEILPKAAKASKRVADRQASPRLIRGRFFIHRYDPARRTQDHPDTKLETQEPQHSRIQDVDHLCGTPPKLPLPPVPKSIQEGRWYLVAELVFRLPYEGDRMNWRMLVEVETNTILFLRALSSAVVSGNVFTYDPITSTGTATNTPDQTNAVLNPHRDSVVLGNLNSPVGGTQSLQGAWATLADISKLTVAPPTRPAGSNFDIWDVRTNEFAAVNAYYHTDRFFRLVANLGFPLATYFDGTAFPIEVDHRGVGDRIPSDDAHSGAGNNINAHCIGDGDGIDHTCYALAHAADIANPIGIATDWRVVLHELAGHGILYDHVGMANLGFAHSAGDSFAVILNDYLSEWHNGAALDRFLLAPFVPAVVRHSDRAVADGWGWGGPQTVSDSQGYLREQVLSTTMFRVYRSIGGDSTSVSRREFAAHFMAYLMLRAVGTLTPLSNPSAPEFFLSALLAADSGNWVSEGLVGGVYGKVLAWSFEKQNLNSGALPTVDVYIDDGRVGEYAYLPVHWATATIWNRRSADGLVGHEEPALTETNYAYVKVKNRGTSVANNVVVKGYHCKPSAGVLWPNDLQPFTTAQLSAGTLQPNNTQEKIVGPFEWTPVTNAWGHDCMLMIVSATGDTSNVDKFTAGEVVEDWRLVPNDNNIAQRNVTLVPGGGSLQGLMAGLHGKGFWVGNSGRTSAKVAVSVALPPLLLSRGWRIEPRGLSKEGERLKAREQRLVTFEVHAGAPFTKAEAALTTERDIMVTATADGAVIGGMVYRIDPELDMPFNERTHEHKNESCRDKAKQLLDCLNVPGAEVKRVRIRKVAIDVEMESGDGGCD